MSERREGASPLPRAGTSLGYAAGALAALYPGMLPRPVWIQCVLILILGGIGAATVGSVRHVWRRTGIQMRTTAFALSTVAVTAAAAGWTGWQDSLRAVAGLAHVSVLDGLGVWFCAAVIPIGARLTASRLTEIAQRRRSSHPPMSLWGRDLRHRVVVVALATAVVAWPAGAVSSAARADTTTPTSPGSRFAAISSAEPGVRVYIPLDAGATPQARADLAVTHLIAAGGLTRRAVVIAVPTGSGWVDAHAVTGTESVLGGDVAVVAVQYAAMPSWQAFLLHRDAATATSDALVEALARRLPPGHPPVYLFGQSLGAVGALAAAERARVVGLSIARVLVSGLPASSGSHPERRTLLQANDSDPVAIWKPALAWTPAHADVSRGLGGAPLPRPAWVPGLSFLQTTVDLLGATAQPVGVGHRYDERQGSALVAPVAPTL
ncbi:alpha/beta-hydrolase family protein [Tsukamurella sp. 8F]|uniref:alpha/beta-hydrolase family protein n=1 Tax=Tsukamurella sp. 8F TaxID=3031961 RepID=UPI0023B974B3|nr:alpha/beta-hydrolase family protein [Tsukamurella sp. 8F]MDF0586091.1 alpha/beta-hydrolase family protein [Tsukamurella sp. 8F]